MISPLDAVKIQSQARSATNVQLTSGRVAGPTWAMAVDAGNQPATEPVMPVGSMAPIATTRDAPSVKSPLPITAPPEPAPTGRTPPSTVIAIQVQTPLSPATPAQPRANTQLAAVASERQDVRQVTRSADAEDVLVRFSNAYESGSIDAFSKLLAPGMAGRRQMLSDYERVFQTTRRRSIKFNQLKHAVDGQRVSTSGSATVTTTDQDNRTVIQRVFLEFEIGSDVGEPRIQRLANYVIN